MIWAKKKKTLILLSSLTFALVVPQIVSLPFYYSLLLEKDETNSLNVVNRELKIELQKNGQSSSKVVNSNQDQNLLILKKVHKSPVLVNNFPKIVPKIEEIPEVIEDKKPDVIVPIPIPTISIIPILEPEEPIEVSETPINQPEDEKPVETVEEIKPIIITPVISETEIKPEPTSTEVITTVIEQPKDEEPKLVDKETSGAVQINKESPSPIETKHDLDFVEKPLVSVPKTQPEPTSTEVITPDTDEHKHKPLEKPVEAPETEQPKPEVVTPIEKPVLAEETTLIPPKSTPKATPKPRFSSTGRILNIGESERDVVVLNDDGSVWTGVPVVIKIIQKDVPPRHKFSDERDNRVANRIPYIHSYSPKIVRVELREEFVAKIKEQVIIELKKILETNNNAFKNLSGVNPEDLDWKNMELSQTILDYLQKGEIPTKINLFVNEKKELDSEGFIPISPTYNPIVGRSARDNSERRYFGYPQFQRRFSNEIENGDFFGWDKQEVTKEWIKFGIKEKQGIEVFNYTTNNPLYSDRNNSIRVVLDASNEIGYNNFIDFINNVQRSRIKIHSFVIKNMGTSSVDQKFFDILNSLPNEIPNLELWLQQPTETNYLYALRNKKIDELSLYTNQHPTSELWAINPLSILNTVYVQTVDSYNEKNQAGDFSRVVFNTLIFDQINYKASESDPLREINLGLRMAYYVRNNEAFFQGKQGTGIENADNEEHSNTYWTNLDLSRIMQIKSLRGLNFQFGEPNKTFLRKLSKLTLYNDSPVFSISVDELNNSQFNEVMNSDGKLKFVGSDVNSLRIIGDTKTLNSEGLNNLDMLYNKIGKDVFKGGAILINNEDNNTRSILEANGYKTRIFNSNL